MAVDTKEKRLSMINTIGVGIIHILPEPDDSIDQGDRQHLLDRYSGVLFEGPPAGQNVPEKMNHFRRLRA